jgi:hypothetical protein
VSDPVVAYAVDEAVALRLLFDEQARAQGSKARGTIPPGQRYETPDEVLSGAGYVN